MQPQPQRGEDPIQPETKFEEQDAAASEESTAEEEKTTLESKPKRDWKSIFQKTFDKINDKFTAAEDEEI